MTGFLRSQKRPRRELVSPLRGSSFFQLELATVHLTVHLKVRPFQKRVNRFFQQAVKPILVQSDFAGIKRDASTA